MGNKKKIKLDKFYTPIAENRPAYNDKLSEIVGEIVVAQTSGQISDTSANALIKIAVMMETQKEMQELGKWIEAMNGNKESSSMVVNILHRERKYA